MAEGTRSAASTRTIAAPATAPGRAAIAVIRISGPEAAPSARCLIGGKELRPREAALHTLHNPSTDEIIDRGLVLWFPAPASFTGEDMVELQVHGSRAVVAAAMRALTEECGIEVARPGEFARRAFENGKLDLTQVEAIADLIDAETEAQRRQATGQLGGAFGLQCEAWRSALIRASALLEAAIDFPEEGIPVETFERAKSAINEVANEIYAVLADNRRGERLREGMTIAIIGPPNAGKSTLLNALAQRDVAIVSEHAGTTRDIIEVELDLDGYPVVLIDTAGLRESADPVEGEGVRRARMRAEQADLRLLVWDATSHPVAWQALGLEPGPGDILLLSKIDRLSSDPPEAPGWPGAAVRASAVTSAGLQDLIDAIGKRSQALFEPGIEPMITRMRHRHELARAALALKEALGVDADYPELMAEELRSAATALGRVTGRIDIEDILDVVFAEFCLGK